MDAPSLRPSSRTSPSPRVASPKEQEYIHNLQQQIRYLELQGSLLREQLAAPGPALTNRGTLASPALEPRLNLAAPLDDPVNAIRERYVREAEDGRRRVAAVEAQGREARALCGKLEAEVSRGSAQVEAAAGDAAQALALHGTRLLGACTANEQASAQLDELRAAVAGTRAAAARWDARTAELLKRAGEAGRRAGELGEKTKGEQRRVLRRTDAEALERRLAESVAAEEALAGDIRRLDSLILHREGELKAETDLCWTLRSKGDALQSEAERLRGRVGALEREAQRALEDLRALGAERAPTLTRLAEMRDQSAAALRRYDELGPRGGALGRTLDGERAGLEAAAARLAGELREAQAREQSQRALLEAAQARRDEAEEDARAAAGFWLERESAAASAAGDLAALERRARGLEGTGTRLRDEADALAAALDDAALSAELLAREIAERDDAGSVDVHELAALRATNEALAGTIGELMRRIPAQGPVGLTLRGARDAP